MRAFLSLKWKALLVFSLLLITVNAGLAGLAYFELKQQFERQRTAVFHARENELQGLIQGAFYQLEKFAGLLPLLNADGGDPADLPSRLKTVAESKGSLLQLEWGVDRVLLYGSGDDLLWQWGRTVDNERLRGWASRANRDELPVSGLECSDGCYLYVAVPLLQAGESAGALMVGSSFADTVLTFRRVTEADIGLVSLEEDARPEPSAAGPAAPWTSGLLALTHQPEMRPVLAAVAEQRTLPDMEQGFARVRLGGRDYEVRAFSLGNENSQVWALIVDDISTHLGEIRRATRRSLLGGLLGLLLSEALLLFLLWAPMARLTRLTELLPRLALSQFSRVREQLGAPAKRALRDEFDVLDATAVSLAGQLQTLQNELEGRARNLAERGEDLARERDFVTGLLDTAPLVILTQDAAGRILSINHWGSRITGFAANDLVGRNFVDLLLPEPDLLGAVHALLELRQGRLQRFQQDSPLRCNDGTERTLSWLHSRLKPHGTHPATLLSVGLDLTDRQAAETQLAWLADHDPLTELANRRRFQSDFEKILSGAKRYHRTGALLYFDLDQFKYVNDTCGHHAGDALLQMVAARLKEIVRESDLVARLGGDEFALVIPETDVEGAKHVAEKIESQLLLVDLSEGKPMHRVSASIGVAVFPLHGDNVQELLANADLAMYQAKDNGRGRWHLFSMEDKAREKMHARVFWRESIEQALEEDRFELHFQPILEILSGTISHYEVLLRMRRESGELVFPGAFIPEAEQSGLINRIDRMVMTKAIGELARLQSQGNDLSFSVNLSGKVMDDPELLPLLTHLIQSYRVEPSRLVFEVTETAAVADMVAAKHLMDDVKLLGCRFSLDDFGVGFSSFYYLKQLPVDYVKIDGAFIRNLAQNREDQVFVKALADVARGLGKKTVAEFVGDEDSLDLLQEYGVDYAQGYYIGKPMPQVLSRIAHRAS